MATYDLSIKESKVSIHSELPQTTVWGFDDGTHGAGYLGPIIEARSNQPVTVNWINDLRDFDTQLLRTSHYLHVDTCVPDAVNDARTVFHLHGGHVPAAVDGYPENTFLPGEPPVTYVYPNNQQAGYLWYHDHALGITRLNVYMGLAGLYFLRDAVEERSEPPVAASYEIPLVDPGPHVQPGRLVPLSGRRGWSTSSATRSSSTARCGRTSTSRRASIASAS